MRLNGGSRCPKAAKPLLKKVSRLKTPFSEVKFQAGLELAAGLQRRAIKGTFQGVCRVDPLSPAAPDDLARLTEQGFRGVRLSPAGNASGDWFRGPLMPPLWKRCQELRVPMTVLAPVARMPSLVYPMYLPPGRRSKSTRPL